MFAVQMQGRGAVQIRQSKERKRQVGAFVRRMWKSPWSRRAERAVSRPGAPVTVQRAPRPWMRNPGGTTELVRPGPFGPGRFLLREVLDGISF